MGVIRKKTASRGTEAGTKYHCDICSVDVTSTVGLSFSFHILFNGCELNGPRSASPAHTPPAPNTISVSPVSQPGKNPRTTIQAHIPTK